MPPALLAVLAGMFFALASFFTRLGLERGTTDAAVRTAAVVAVAVSWPLFFFLAPWTSLSSWAVLAFVAAGVCGPFLGRLLLFTGLQRVGVAVTTPIYNVQVLFTAVAGVLFFSETLTPFIGIGTVAMLVGLALLSLDASGGNRDRPRRTLDLLFPLGAGFFIAITYVFRKWGLQITPEVFFGLAVMSVTALVTSMGMGAVKRQGLSLPGGRTLVMFAIGGAMAITAHLCVLGALLRGDLLIVVPLQNMEPLFAVVLSRLFLRRLELVTPAVAAGAALVVTGGVLVNL
ncbi:MAG: DMT family transporter [Chloroflexota bacterium]|nr:DMT family transporter [Chloroflexota bacterium]MDE2968696.1 DMT family transporter [Chloroflexota bacterium]